MQVTSVKSYTLKELTARQLELLYSAIRAACRGAADGKEKAEFAEIETAIEDDADWTEIRGVNL